MQDTRSFLNSITQPTTGTTLRRKSYPIYDQIVLATGTTLYQPFKAVNANGIGWQNIVLPLSGTQIFAITSIGLLLEGCINTGTLFQSLLVLLQQSYLEIDISDRQILKIPLLQCTSFQIADSIGVSPAVTTGMNSFVGRKYKLTLPIIINSTTNIVVNVVIPSASATSFNTYNLNVKLEGVMSDVLDPAFNFNPVVGNQFQELDYTFWQTVLIASANAGTYNLFTGNLANNLYSQLLPLPQNARFEIQNLEIFFGGTNNVNNQPYLIQADRAHNNLLIKVDDTVYFNDSIFEFASIGAGIDQTFDDNASPTVSTNTSTITWQHFNKTLELPITLPATGNTVIQLSQPGSSLLVNQYFTAMFRGRYLRQIQ
jgi:hypothetical protein